MTVVVTAAMALVIVVTTAVASLGGLYAARTAAQTAADAAALAAAVSTYPLASATGPEQAARLVAAENGARLIDCRCPLDSSLQSRVVEVVTSVTASIPVLGEREVQAVARAEFDPVLWLGA